MRKVAAFVTYVCLAACSATPMQSASEQELTTHSEGWRQRQAELDADAILAGMAQARYRAQALARMGR
jgi:hypothetical protein